MKNVHLIVCSFLVLHLSLDAQSLKIENIIGGDTAAHTDYPYHAFVSVSNSVCNGAIVDEWHIVTAAHCITDDKGRVRQQPIKITTGISNFKEKSTLRFDAIAEIVYLHKDFDPLNKKTMFPGDIAVLKLNKMMLLDGLYMEKVTLPSLFFGRNPELYVDEELIFTGFGLNTITNYILDDKTIITNGNITGDLRFSKTRVLSFNECSKSRPRGSFNLIKEFCCRMDLSEDMKPRGACLGDSGGPVVLKNGEENILIGILSRGSLECNEQIRPSIYTRISYYTDFIDCTRYKSFFQETKCDSVSGQSGVLSQVFTLNL